MGKNISILLLTARLSRYLQFLVVDKTGLRDSYDFQYEYPDNNPNTLEVLANSIVTSIEGVGLKLESVVVHSLDCGAVSLHNRRALNASCLL